MGPLPRQYQRDAQIIFILLAIIYAYFFQDAGWNGNSRFGLIFASVQERRLSIDDYYAKPGTKTGDLAYYNGHYYSDKAIGPSLVGAVLYVPLFWLQQAFNRPDQDTVKIILTFLVIGLPSAIAGSLMYVFLLYLSGSRFRSYLVTLAVTLGTMYFPFSTIFFSHQLTSSLLFIAFLMIFLLKEEPDTIRKKGYVFFIGLLMGWALISEYPSAIIILGLMFYYFAITWRIQNYRNFSSVVLPVVGVIIPVLLQLSFNKLCFGSFFSLGYTNYADQSMNSAMQQGVLGFGWPSLNAIFYMTLHPAMGLFWQSPVLLLSIIGAGILFIQGRYRDEAFLAVWSICSTLIIMSGYWIWWGGSSFGPRYLIPVLPFFSILLVFSPKRINWLLLVLSIISIGQMLIVAASDVKAPDTWIAKIRTMGFFEYSNIFSFCLKQLEAGNFAQNLGHWLLGLNSWASLIPVMAVIIGITIYFFGNKMKPQRLKEGFST